MPGPTSVRLDSALCAVSLQPSEPLPSKSTSVKRRAPHWAGPRPAGRLRAGPREAGRRVLPTPGPARADSLFPPRLLRAAGFLARRELCRIPRLGAQRAGYLRFFLDSYCFLKEYLCPLRPRGSGVRSRGWAGLERWAVRSAEPWCRLLTQPCCCSGLRVRVSAPRQGNSYLGLFPVAFKRTRDLPNALQWGPGG